MDASTAADSALRAKLAGLLESGLRTEWRERAGDSDAVNRIVARLAAVAPDDQPARLCIAGFTVTPFEGADVDAISQACETCMYYASHRQFCELPELRLPVRPEWSCRLWRI